MLMRWFTCASSGRGGGDAYRQVYLEGCRNLVQRFPDARLLFTSSSSVYAQVNGERVTEESETVPDRETGKILLEAEQVVTGAGGVVARLAGIYGPGRSVLLRKFQSGEAVIEDDGKRFINQIHRDDAAKAVFHLLTLDEFSGGEIFNVSDSGSLSQLEVYQGLARIFGKDLPPFGPRDLNRKRGWTHKRVSNEKAQVEGLGAVVSVFLGCGGRVVSCGETQQPQPAARRHSYARRGSYKVPDQVQRFGSKYLWAEPMRRFGSALGRRIANTVEPEPDMRAALVSRR